MGLTINTMSLGGMAIAIGSLVDDAIVDVENVYKRLRENRLLPENERLSVIQVVFNASKEVRMPILNSTLIIVVSFVPLFFLSGMEGRMLVPLGIAFIVALFASTIVALTLTPVLCSYLLGKEKGDKLPKEAFVARWMKGVYEKALTWVLIHKRLTLGSTIGLFIITLGFFFTLGRSFLPHSMKVHSPSTSVRCRASHSKRAIRWDTVPRNFCSLSPRYRQWPAKPDVPNWTSMLWESTSRK